MARNEYDKMRKEEKGYEIHILVEKCKDKPNFLWIH